MPLSEAKALFYKSDLEVPSGIFIGEKRYLCNVVEDYCNVIILLFIIGLPIFYKITLSTRKILLFLFILTALDLVHLGLLDMQYFIALKLLISYLLYLSVCTRLKQL